MSIYLWCSANFLSFYWLVCSLQAMTLANSAFEAPHTFISPVFIGNVRERLIAYDRCLGEFGDYIDRAWDLILIEYKNKKPIDDQRRISVLYDNVMTTARECVLTLAFFWKNIDIMPFAVARITPDLKRIPGFGLRIGAYTHRENLERDIKSFSNMMFNVLENIQALMTEETLKHRVKTPFRGDPYVIERLQGKPLRREDFDNWVEFNFYRAFKLPLGMMKPNERTENAIAREIFTQLYGQRMAVRVVKGELHRLFPGLSFDMQPQTPEQLGAYGSQLCEHVTDFTPSTLATIVRPHDITKRFGRLSFSPRP